MEQLKTIEQAIALIQKHSLDDKVNAVLEGELKTLSICIEGPGYHGQLTGELARGLVEFQDEIYRAARSALLEDRGRLSAAQKELFELSIEVADGSTLINIDAGNIAIGLSEAFQRMTPGELTVLSVAVATVLAGAWLGKNWLSEHYQTKREKTADEEETKRLTAVTEAMSRLVDSDSRISRFSSAASNGIREIALRATGATSVTVGPVTIDEDDLANLRKRAPRTTSESLHEIGLFRVYSIDGKGALFKMTLGSASMGGEFDVEFEKSDFSNSEMSQLTGALTERREIRLEVQAVRMRDKIRGGVLIQIDPSI